jgi:hypothetical protein
MNAWNRIRTFPKSYGTTQCKYQQGPHSPTTLYTHIQNIKWHRQEKRSYAVRTRGKVLQISRPTLRPTLESEKLPIQHKWVNRGLYFRVTIYHSQFSLHHLQQRFGTHGTILPLTHTSLISHWFLSYVTHSDSRGALSTILFQIRWVLGSLPLPYSTFSGFIFSFSKLRGYDTQTGRDQCHILTPSGIFLF